MTASSITVYTALILSLTRANFKTVRGLCIRSIKQVPCGQVGRDTFIKAVRMDKEEKVLNEKSNVLHTLVRKRGV